MIEGIKIVVKSEELKKMFQDKVRVHQGKLDFYKKQLETMVAANETQDNNIQNSYDPGSNFKGKIAEHTNKLVYYKFMMEHIIPNEEYLLSETDLLKLEVVERFF